MNFRKYIIYFLLGLMVTSAGLNWKIPFINTVKAQDKSTAVDKSEELNALTINRTRTYTKSFEISDSKSLFHEVTESNFENKLIPFKAPQFKLITFRSAIDIYLHLLQLF